MKGGSKYKEQEKTVREIVKMIFVSVRRKQIQTCT